MDALIVAAVTGVASSIATVITLRTDIGWIKRILDQHDRRIGQLESNKSAS
jgi:hypothetical protein